MNHSRQRLSRQELLMAGACLLLLAALPLIAQRRRAAPPAPDLPAIELPKAGTDVVVAFSPDGKYLVGGTGSPLGSLGLWSWPDGKMVWTAHPAPNVDGVSLSPDGLFLLSQEYKVMPYYGLDRQGNPKVMGSVDKERIVMRRTSTGKVLFAVPSPPNCGTIRDFLFSPDGKYLISTGDRLDVWDWQKGVVIKTLARTGDHEVAAFAADGTLALPRVTKEHFRYNEEEMLFWDLTTFKIKRRMRLPDGDISHFAFSMDGRLLALITEKSTRKESHTELQVRDARTGSLLWKDASVEGVTYFAMSPDGRYLAVAYTGKIKKTTGRRSYTEDQRYLGFWDSYFGKKLGAHVIEDEINTFALSADGKTLAYMFDYQIPHAAICYLTTPESSENAR